MEDKNRTTERAVEKWATAAEAGFQTLPDILLKKQVELGLSPTDMLVLINITMHWWYRDQLPFPRSVTIAERIGADPRTVQRSIRKMQDLELIERKTETLEDGSTRSVLNLSGLVDRLSRFAKTDRDYLARQQRRRVA